MGRRHRKPVLECDEDGEVIARYDSVKDVARAKDTSHSNILYWIRSGYMKDGSIYRFENPEDEHCAYTYNTYHKQKDGIPIELDRNQYTILPYEVKFGRICITPCPFKEHPKPMVGSGNCARCGQFRGRDIANHEIACSRK